MKQLSSTSRSAAIISSEPCRLNPQIFTGRMSVWDEHRSRRRTVLPFGNFSASRSVRFGGK